MNNSLGTFANLTGKRIGKFTIESLAGRDKSSAAPVWRVVCDRCNYPQTLAHAKLASLVQGKHTQISLLCANPACPASRHERETESLADVRRKERQDSIVVVAAQREAAEKAEKDRQRTARADRILREFTRYLNHQWRVGAADEQICTSRRWSSLSDASRKAVLDAMKANPNKRIDF